MASGKAEIDFISTSPANSYQWRWYQDGRGHSTGNVTNANLATAAGLAIDAIKPLAAAAIPVGGKIKFRRLTIEYEDAPQ